MNIKNEYNKIEELYKIEEEIEEAHLTHNKKRIRSVENFFYNYNKLKKLREELEETLYELHHRIITLQQERKYYNLNTHYYYDDRYKYLKEDYNYTYTMYKEQLLEVLELLELIREDA